MFSRVVSRYMPVIKPVDVWRWAAMGDGSVISKHRVWDVVMRGWKVGIVGHGDGKASAWQYFYLLLNIMVILFAYR